MKIRPWLIMILPASSKGRWWTGLRSSDRSAVPAGCPHRETPDPSRNHSPNLTNVPVVRGGNRWCSIYAVIGKDLSLDRQLTGPESILRVEFGIVLATRIFLSSLRQGDDSHLHIAADAYSILPSFQFGKNKPWTILSWNFLKKVHDYIVLTENDPGQNCIDTIL